MSSQKYKCGYCGYEAKESEFLSGTCPACCRDLETGERDPNAIPLVFHKTDEEE